jgi:hypothetical protein
MFLSVSRRKRPWDPPSSVCNVGSIAVGLNRPELETDTSQVKNSRRILPRFLQKPLWRGGYA